MHATNPKIQSAVLLHAFTDAALARVQSLAPADHGSHRAAVAYLLHEWLRSLEPTLFPPPSTAKVRRL